MKTTLKQNTQTKITGLRSLGLLLFAVLAALLIGSSALLLRPTTAKACPDCENTGGITLTLNSDMSLTSTAVETEGYVIQLCIIEGRKNRFDEFIGFDGCQALSFPVNLRELYTNGTLITGREYSFVVLYQEGMSFDIYQHSNIIYYTCDTYVPMVTAPTKPGFTFTGWYYDEACTQKYNSEPITSATKLYAGWAVLTYTVRLNTNGGEVLENLTVEYNKAVQAPTPARTGYDFLGWYLPDGTQYTNQAIQQNTVLTAKWQIQTFPVTFYVDGEVYKTLPVSYGQILGDVMKENGMQFYSVKSVAAADGSALEDFSCVTGEMSVVITEKTGIAKAWTFVKINWIWFVSCAGVILLACLITGAVVAKKKTK